MGLIIVKSQIASLVKEISKEKHANINNITSDFAPALDKKVKEVIEEAVVRAKENNRRTLMGRDV